MKLSQMTTDQAADVAIRITVPIANIMRDKDSAGIVEGLAKADEKKPLQYIAGNLTIIATALLKTHRDDVYEIISALTGKSASEIGAQRLIETMTDIRESVDEDLVGFFGSSGQQQRNNS